MIQQGAKAIGKDKGWMKIIWTHVDLGSNTHISNSTQHVTNIMSTSTGLGQVSGSKAPIFGIGDWNVLLAGRSIRLPETLVMSNNPTSTLGGAA